MSLYDTPTLKSLPEKGRYKDDLYAELSYDPCAKKPYRVDVAIWRCNTWLDEDGNEVWQWNGLGMLNYTVHEGFLSRGAVKEYRSLDRAIRRLFEVRAAAERGLIVAKIHKQDESRRQVLS